MEVVGEIYSLGKQLVNAPGRAESRRRRKGAKGALQQDWLGHTGRKRVRRRKGRGDHLDRILRGGVAGNKHLKTYQVREVQ